METHTDENTCHPKDNQGFFNISSFLWVSLEWYLLHTVCDIERICIDQCISSQCRKLCETNTTQDSKSKRFKIHMQNVIALESNYILHMNFEPCSCSLYQAFCWICLLRFIKVQMSLFSLYIVIMFISVYILHIRPEFQYTSYTYIVLVFCFCFRVIVLGLFNLNAFK